jgi:hypothetical protein
MAVMGISVIVSTTVYQTYLLNGLLVYDRIIEEVTSAHLAQELSTGTRQLMFSRNGTTFESRLREGRSKLAPMAEELKHVKPLYYDKHIGIDMIDMLMNGSIVFGGAHESIENILHKIAPEHCLKFQRSTFAGLEPMWLALMLRRNLSQFNKVLQRYVAEKLFKLFIY